MSRIEVRDRGNYGYALREAAERFGLDADRMIADVKAMYEELGVQPICVLCDVYPPATSCTEKKPLDPSCKMWHCNGMTISRKTIEKYQSIE